MFLKLEPEAYEALCQETLRRDKWRCRSCGYRQTLAAHHIVFRSQGGDDTSENLITLCTSCHRGVHDSVKDGLPGLIIEVLSEAGANVLVRFSRREDWRPT